MAGILHTYIPNRVIDTNGIADGSEIAFYYTGGTTPAPIYTTSALSVEMTNPVVVNAGAAVPDIYLDPDITYRRIVTYSDGSTDDTDPYTGISTSGTSFVQAGTGAVSRTGQAKARERITGADFGTAADASTDNSTAIANTIKAAKGLVSTFTAAGDGQGKIEFAPGVHKITTSGVFSQANSPQRDGYLAQGSGKGSTIIWMVPGGTDKYFYDNGASIANWALTFRDMTFSGGTTWRTQGNTDSNIDTHVKGFKFTGPNWESAHVFDTCSFVYVNDVLTCSGSDNADTIRFDKCDFTKCGRLLFIDNTQSFCVSLSQCYQTLNYGYNVLEFGPNCAGGGNFSWNQGAVIMVNSRSVDSYVVHAVNGGTGESNAPVAFSDMRFELRTQYDHIAKLTYGFTHAIFDRCTFFNLSSVEKEWAEVGGTCWLSFRDCHFYDQGTGGVIASGTWTMSVTGGLSLSGQLDFENCELPNDFFHNINWSASSYGIVRLRNCYNRVAAPTTSPQAPTNMVAMDCDILGPTSDVGGSAGFGYSASFGMRGRELKYANMRHNSVAPSGATGLAGATIVLPPYSTIRKVIAKIQPGTGAAQTYQLHIGNADKSTSYATSTTANQNDAAGHTAVAENLNLNTGAPGAVFVGSISSTTLTVSSFTRGQALAVGDTIFSTRTGGITLDTRITALGTGTGGTGTYTISQSATIAAGTIMKSIPKERIIRVWADDGAGSGANAACFAGTYSAGVEYF